jgi:hypothetical protein
VESLKRGLIKAEKKAAGTRDRDLLGAGRRELAAQRESGSLSITRLNPDRRLAEGGEHRVELSVDGKRVIKHTKGGLFGYQPDVNSTGNIVHRPSAASEYIQRQEMQNRIFGSDLKLEGSHAAEGGGLTYSQTFINGQRPSVPDIVDHMDALGFKKVSPRNIYSETLEHTTFFNPKTFHVVGDAKSENFRRTADGRIHALDLMITRAAPGSALHTALTKGIE